MSEFEFTENGLMMEGRMRNSLKLNIIEQLYSHRNDHKVMLQYNYEYVYDDNNDFTPPNGSGPVGFAPSSHPVVVPLIHVLATDCNIVIHAIIQVKTINGHPDITATFRSPGQLTIDININLLQNSGHPAIPNYGHPFWNETLF